MKQLTLLLLAVLLVSTSCNKLLEFPPEELILAEDALNTPEDLQRLLNSCYDVMANVFDGDQQVVAELLSDNLRSPVNNTTDQKAIYDRETTFFTTASGVYADYYFTILRCNALLESFDLIEGLSEAERTRIEAEAFFLRGLCHWLCVQVFAQPYGYTSDNSHLGIIVKVSADPAELPRRSTVADAYDQVLADLQNAYDALPTQNGAYATRWSAAAALANVYFTMGNYMQAEQYASEIIQSGQFSLQSDIWRYQPDVISSETIFGTVSLSTDVRNGVLRDNYNGPTANLRFSEGFASFMALTPSDLRNNWLEIDGGSVFCRKFYAPPGGADGAPQQYFNIPVFHLTEMFLLRAEAVAQMNMDGTGNVWLGQAIADVNAIRDRAFGFGINNLPVDADAETVRDAAREEYHKETVCEGKWQRQLKRRGAIHGEDIMVRDAPWDCSGMALQFPNSEGSVEGFVFNPEGGCN